MFRQLTFVPGIPTGRRHGGLTTPMRVSEQFLQSDGKKMNQLGELSVACTEQKRIELARLLATGVIRVLLQQKSQDQSDSTQTEPEMSDEGLEYS